ncbi:MAG: prepilin-type N-terminal cleavage/methylation domain-containing protein [Pseudomonadota bacterium]|nr:prepilin-type N-terminal cleavage/methylation domain-containing protein [Pseudomonadota bacterium]
MRRQAGFGLPELMIAVGIVSILASQAIPTYLDYVTRARITEGLHMAMRYEPDVTEYFTTTGRMPLNAAMGIQGALAVDRARYVNGIEYQQVSATLSCLLVNFNAAAVTPLQGSRNRLLLVAIGTENSVDWECGVPESASGGDQGTAPAANSGNGGDSRDGAPTDGAGNASTPAD